MSKGETFSFVLDGILVIAIALGIYFIISSHNRATWCESHQSEVCPQYFCANETQECGERAYREVDGERICESKSL